MTFNVVSISGGKDSTAMLLLALEKETENLRAVFADTGHEHPQTYEFVNYIQEATGVPIQRVKADFTSRIAHKREVIQTKWRDDGISEEKIQEALEVMQPTGIPFLDLCLYHGRFPSTRARFCSSELKHEPIYLDVIGPLLDEGHKVISWQGVRSEESPERALLPEREDTGGGLFNYRPLLAWSAEDVFRMHDRHGIKPNPLYKQGMGRVGCMPCIHG